MAATDPEKMKFAVTYPVAPAAQRFHVDGAVGGLTPQGLLAVSFYAELFPPPVETELIVSSDTKTPGEERFAKPQPAIQREIQTSIIMTLETARVLHAWLGEKVSQLHAARLEK